MESYSAALSNVFKDWKKAIIVVIFTIARVIYGWHWFKAGWEKMVDEHWLSDGKLNSQGKIQGLVDNIATHAHRFDPLHLNNLFGWIAQHIFLNMPAFTDFLVVIFEMLIGLVIIFGFKVFWGALVATFLNLQFMAAGSYNNFGYIWTNLAIMKWAKYFDAVGVDGYFRSKKGKEIL